MIHRRALSLLDAREIVRDVRPEDRTEWFAAAAELGLEPNLTLLISGCIEQAAVGGTIVAEGRPVCIWGASAVGGGSGLAWLIATVRGQEVAHRIQRHFAAAIREMHEVFHRIEAHAFEENSLHHHWMERLGFTRAGRSDVFPSGRFIMFERDASSKCALTR